MIDPNMPQSLVFLRNVEKRARKYEAGIAIISHSVVDFLDPQIKMYGQALLDIPCFKILMGCDGKNLLETKEIYNLTDAEEEPFYSVYAHLFKVYALQDQEVMQGSIN